MRYLPSLPQVHQAMWLSVVVGVCFVLCLFTACFVPNSGVSLPHSTSSIFRMNLGTEPPDLDPVKMTDLTSFTVVQNIMRGLTTLDPAASADTHKLASGTQISSMSMNSIKPAIAKRWDISPDGMTYTFYLRNNAVWSDNKPVTAHDFVYAWQRALNPNSRASYAFFLFEILNAKPYYEGKLKDFSQVGVVALNDHTLRVRLERPIAFFLGLMAAPISLPLREDMITKHGDSFTEAKNFITNGPYLLSEWQHGEKITLKPNDKYYGEKPKVEAIEMVMVNDANTSVVMYENNELDYIETTTSIPSFDVRRLKDNPDVSTSNLHRINYFGFDTTKAPFNDPKVRRAFTYAIDRSYYPKLLKSGQKPTASWITPGLEGYNAEKGLRFNPVKAKELLAEAGYPNGKGFPEVTLGYVTKYDIQKEAEIAQFLWKKHLNINVRLENMEWKVFLSRLKEDPPSIHRLGWFVDYPDADSFMSMMTSDSGNNHTGWKNPTYDALVAEAAVTRDPSKRQMLYDNAQTLLLEVDSAIAPIYLAEKTYLLKPHIHGFKMNELNLINLDKLSFEPSTP